MLLNPTYIFFSLLFLLLIFVFLAKVIKEYGRQLVRNECMLQWKCNDTLLSETDWSSYEYQ